MPQIQELSSLGRLVYQTESRLVSEIVDYLLRLVCVPNIIGEFLEVLLQPLVLLLVICQSLQASLLGPLVPVDLGLAGCTCCSHILVLKRSDHLALPQRVFLVTYPEHLCGAEVPVVAG